MTTDGESRYTRAFARLLADEDLVDPRVFARVDSFDEVPIYSRLSQLDFLGDLSIADQNRELVRAAVRHLDAVEGYFSTRPEENDDRVLRLVSIVGWWVDGERGGGMCTDGTVELIRPNLWVGNLGSEKMKDFRLYHPRSACADFVMGALGRPDHAVFESRLDEATGWCPRRVYVVRPAGLAASVVY